MDGCDAMDGWSRCMAYLRRAYATRGRAYTTNHDAEQLGSEFMGGFTSMQGTHHITTGPSQGHRRAITRPSQGHHRAIAGHIHTTPTTIRSSSARYSGVLEGVDSYRPGHHRPLLGLLNLMRLCLRCVFCISSMDKPVMPVCSEAEDSQREARRGNAPAVKSGGLYQIVAARRAAPPKS